MMTTSCPSRGGRPASHWSSSPGRGGAASHWSFSRTPSRPWTTQRAGHDLAFVSVRLFPASPATRTAGLPSVASNCSQCITAHAFGSKQEQSICAGCLMMAGMLNVGSLTSATSLDNCVRTAVCTKREETGLKEKYLKQQLWCKE